MDISSYLLGKKAGGGSSVKVQSNKDATITSNTTTEISPDTGYDALGKVSVTTNVQPDLESKSVTISSNTTTTITPTTGKDGLSSVEVTTNVPGIVPTGTIEITENGTVDVTNYATADVSVSGGGGYSGDDVVFYDYDGTIVDSYSKADFLQLTDMPSNPSHTGLTAQGWNWTLADAKTHVQKYDRLLIGQQYVTSDGSTRFYINLQDGRTSPYLSFAVSGSVSVDWGDGNTQTITGTSSSTRIDTQHNYSQGGNYIITLSSQSTITFMGDGNNENSQVIWNGVSSDRNYVYRNSVKKIELGSNIALNSCSFAKMYCLNTITIPSTMTTLGQKVFAYTSLDCVVIPSGITTIPQSLFKSCEALSSVILSKVTSLDPGAFNGCYSLRNITLPDGLTSIANNVFKDTYSIEKLTFPSSISSFNTAAISNCHSLEEVIFSEGMTSIGGSWTQLKSLKKITVPGTVSSFAQSQFQNCNMLEEIIFAEGCTTTGSYMGYSLPTLRKIQFPSTMTTIASNSFQGSMYSVSSVVMPSSISSIGNNCFTGISQARFIDFSNHTSIPTLGNTSFGPGSSDFKIIVPDDLYEDWIVANSWSSLATYIIKKSDWDAQ